MHCIITDDKKIIAYAKRKGQQVVEIEKTMIIKNEVEVRYSKITPEMVERFFMQFPNIYMETLGTKCLKHILLNRLGYNENLERTVYPIIAKKNNTTSTNITSAIMNTYCTCIRNIPECYQSFFEKYECSVHWDKKHSFEFVKVCQKYIDENAESLMEKISEEKELIPETIDAFLRRFLRVDEESLGYKSLKYILENKLNCNGDYDKDIYCVLAKKYTTDVAGIKRAMTCIIKKYRTNMPMQYKEFFLKHTKNNIGNSREERDLLFIRICQLYLRKHGII